LFANHFGMSAPKMLDLAHKASMPVIFSWHKKSPLESGLFKKPAPGRLVALNRRGTSSSMAR
jgi:hypothetical protein